MKKRAEGPGHVLQDDQPVELNDRDVMWHPDQEENIS